MGEREREGLGVVTMRAVVVLLVLGAVAGKDLFEMKDLPDLSKLTHITQVPEELGKAAVEKVEDMPGFGPNDDEAETATPPNWDMNAPDQQALDTELGSVDMALIELSQDQQEQQPAEAPAQKASAEAPITLPPTRAAAIIGKGVLSRECLNNCGGLCRQMCARMYQQVRQHGRDPAEQPLLRPLRHQTHEESPGRAEEPATDPEATSERDRRWCRPPLKAIRFRATTKGKSCFDVRGTGPV